MTIMHTAREPETEVKQQCNNTIVNSIVYCVLETGIEAINACACISLRLRHEADCTTG